MDLHTEYSKRSCAISWRQVALAIAAMGLLSFSAVSGAEAGRMGSGVKAPAPVAKVTIGQARFNPATTGVTPSQKPSVAKEPCRGGHRCGNPWPGHQH